MAVAEERPIYQRILIKYSGEAFMAENNHSPINAQKLTYVAQEIFDVAEMGVQVAVVIGAGNFFRGKVMAQGGWSQVTADQMGMMATIINALALRNALEQEGVPADILSALPVRGIVTDYDRRIAIDLLEQGKVVILAGGTGNPLVTTDSTASLRGIELNANIILKATNVDGIYSTDPRRDRNAKRYQRLSYEKVLKSELAVMDLGAFYQCRDHQKLLRVFNMNQQGALRQIVLGEEVGTLVAATEDEP